MNPRRLFIASCISLVASAFSFVIRQDVLPAWGQSFNLDALKLGTIAGNAFLGMATSMAIGSFIVDALGMKRMLGLAFLCHLVGTGLTVGTPYLYGGNSNTAFSILWFATFLVGCANGFVEIGINPLAATLYPKEKTHMLNILHAWWPGGLCLGGLIALAITRALGLDSGNVEPGTAMLGWQIKIGLIFIPTIVYGVMFFSAEFPVTERVASGISTADMISEAFRPMFLLWAFCMLLTASTELAPQGMQSLVLEKTANMNGTIILIYTSTMMFILRHFAGPIAHKLSPVGMLTGSAILSAVGLFLLSFAYDRVSAIGAATIFGLGITYFWPTMLGVTAERFPRGGAFLLGIMGCVGNLAIGVVSPWMGGINDSITLKNIPAELQNRVVVERTVKDDLVKQLPAAEQKIVADAQSEGAKWSFRYVSALPLALVFIFGAIALSDRARGGYRPELLTPRSDIEEASLASDY
ncbi:MAG: MFS transporter [Isosphaeraceae bacterium]